MVRELREIVDYYNEAKIKFKNSIKKAVEILTDVENCYCQFAEEVGGLCSFGV